MKRSNDKRLAISAGDPQGIGPEVSLRAAVELHAERPEVALQLHGPAALLARIVDEFGIDIDGAGIAIVDHPFDEDAAAPAPSAAGGAAALAALRGAVAEVEAGRADALVTAPLAKEAVARIEPGFSGHTEWLGERSGARPLMLLANELGETPLRVALVTTHLPLAGVAAALDVEKIVAILGILRRDLKRWFGVEKPRIAVLGLNPHAGEGGLLGREEIEIIAPAVERAGAGVRGPFSADSFFRPELLRDFDAVLAMYHDQGLIPVKMAGFGSTVNCTLGLPIIRSSPDHGTGFDLRARAGRPDPGSMLAALRRALKAVEFSGRALD